MSLVTGTYEVVSDKAKDNQVIGRVSFVDSKGDPVDIGGGDVTVTIADVQGLQAALNGKAATTAIPTADTLSGASTVGKSVIKASDAASARTAIGAGTSSVVLPATATAAELEAGTVTTTRMVSPKLIHDEIARQIAAIPAA